MSPQPAPPPPATLLTVLERVDIAHNLRQIDDTMLSAARAYSPDTGIPFITHAQHNAQIEDLIEALQRLKKGQSCPPPPRRPS